MNAEQTWPDEHDVVGEHQRMFKLSCSKSGLVSEKIEKKRVPKGTSSYQAAWIVDSEDDEDNSDEGASDEDEDELETDEPMEEAALEEEEDTGDVDFDDRATDAASEMMDDIEDDVDEVMLLSI